MYGNVQVRIDFFLEPTDPRYYDTYVQVPDIPIDAKPPEDESKYEEWLKQFPLKWQLNPFHSHFIYVSPTASDNLIKAEMEHHLPNFYKAFVEDRWDAVKGGIRHGWDTAKRIRPTRYNKILSANDYSIKKSQCETKVASLTEHTTKPDVLGDGESFHSTDIDVGAAATDRTNREPKGYTTIILVNPSNDTGTIDTVELWVESNVTGMIVGTFYNPSGKTYTCNDSESIGDVTAGSKQTFTGLDIDIESGEWIGNYFDSGYIEANPESPGQVYASGEHIGPGDSASYNTHSVAHSCYGTGSTAGGWTNIAKVNGVASANIAKINGVAVANIAKLNGVAV